MKPTESIEYALRFAAGLSAWWLLALLPLAAAAGWWLYRVQFKNVARPSQLVLLALRIFLIAMLVFLAFRPSLVRRQVLTYPGRVLMLVDDSLSMSTADNALTDDAALHLARRLAGHEMGQGDTYYHMARLMSGVSEQMRAFEAYARTADRSSNTFWERAGKSQDRLLENFDKFGELTPAAPALADEPKKKFVDLTQEVSQLRNEVKVFFSADKNPGKKAYSQFCDKCGDLGNRLLDLQGAKDLADIAAGGETLKNDAAAIRAKKRLQLVTGKLAAAQKSLPQLARDQYFQFVSLNRGDRAAAGDFNLADLAPAAGATDILGRLESITKDKIDADFPLSAVIYFGDGRDLSGRSPAAVEQAMAQKQVPLYAAAAGTAGEPYDIAILDVTAPPFAAKGSPVNVRVPIKAVLRDTTNVQLEILKNNIRVAMVETEVRADEPQQALAISFTPAETGLFRYTARIAATPGEAFPLENNSADFVVNVRDDKVKVLLVDWKPRWETRFALNIFQRLDYIDLNPIILLTQKEPVLKRGVQKGSWPDNAAALATYDLIVLGELPDDALSAADWDALRKLVEEKGKTVCFLGNGVADPVPHLADAEALLPVQPRGASAATQPASKFEDIKELRLSEAGLLHPITRRLAGKVEAGARLTWPALEAGTQVLMTSKDTGQPLVSCRFAGKGKTLMIDTDQLWKALNPTALAAHGQMYLAMVTWAVEGGIAVPAAEKKPALALDQRTFSATDGLQVWVTGGAGTVEAVSEGKVIAEANALVVRPDASVARCEFGNLPPAAVSFRLKDDPQVASPEVVIVQDDPELKYLSQNETFLRHLAAATGGEYRSFTDFEEFFQQMTLKKRVDPRESEWRLWDARWILALLVCVLTVEWVWRKLVGLV